MAPPATAVLSYLIAFVDEITQPDGPKAGGLVGPLAPSWLFVIGYCTSSNNNNLLLVATFTTTIPTECL